MEASLAEAIAELNNKGVHEIKRGKYSHACRYLSKAVYRTRQAMMESPSLFDLKSEKPCLDSRVSFVASPITERFLNTAPSGVDSINHSVRILSIPFEINYDFDSRKFLPLTDVTSTCVVVIFNLAIARQLKAITESVSHSSTYNDLKGAMRLYELSYKLYANEMVELDVHYSIATLNNLAHIHYHLGDSVKAKQCCEGLLRCIMYVAQQFDFKDMLKCYFWCVWRLILNDPCTAPAA